MTLLDDQARADYDRLSPQGQEILRLWADQDDKGKAAVMTLLEQNIKQ